MLQITDQRLKSLLLGHGGKGVDRRELTPTHRSQLSCRIELHGAASQRDHAVHQGEILADEALDVAHQFGFAAIALKHALLKPGALSQRHPGHRRRWIGKRRQRR